jgi:hypothetical protein
MKAFAVFANGIACEVGTELTLATPQDAKPVRVEISGGYGFELLLESARRGATAAAYGLRKLRQPEAQHHLCAFFDLKPNDHQKPKMVKMVKQGVIGQSADLLFTLAFVGELIERVRAAPLRFAIAATGELSNYTREAQVKGIRGVNLKLQAALRTLVQGDKFVYPQDNDADIKPALRAKAVAQGIVLLPVDNVCTALEQALGLLPGGLPTGRDTDLALSAGITCHSHEDGRTTLLKRVSEDNIARLDVIGTNLDATCPAIVKLLTSGRTVRAVVLHPDVSKDKTGVGRLFSNVNVIQADCSTSMERFLLRTHDGMPAMPCVLAYDQVENLVYGYIGWFTYNMESFEPSRIVAIKNPVLVMEGDFRADELLIKEFAEREFRRHWDSGLPWKPL